MKQEKNPVDTAQKWSNALKLAKREDERWVKRGKKIVRRYRDDRNGYSDTARKFNILWSNIQTMLPALYGKTPRAQVERRYKDQDPVGRTAATILERALQYEIDHHGDFDSAIRSAVVDRLLPGRGVAWVRFEAKEYAQPQQVEDQAEMQAEMAGVPEPEETEYECTPCDYVYWEDFRCSPARTWEEVTWVARRVYMSRKDVIERFGKEHAEIPLTHEPIGLDEMKKNGEDGLDDLKKAQVWEIWCKTSKAAYWIAEGYGKALDTKDDPYGLDGFWPCPKPLFATQSTDTLVPVPDYTLYQDQAQELDSLTQRIHMLTEAVKVVGVYDASQPAIARMLSEGVNNTMIPVDQWAQFAERGGMKGAVDFLPLDQVLLALQNCYQAREQAKQVIYEITGLSDIIRGASMASETATAQQIKSQYASLRLKRLQGEVAMFASDLLRIKAQMMCDLYTPESLVAMSGVMNTPDAQYVQQAIELMKSEPARGFRIEVAADSLVEMDEASEKASRTEFMTAFGSVMRESLPMIQAAPEMGNLIGEVLMFVVRTFKGGRQLENVLEQTIAKMNEPKPEQQGPSPEQLQVEAQQQMEQAKLQQTMQSEQLKLQSAQQMEQLKAQTMAEVEQFKAQQAIQLEQMKQQAETERQAYKAQLDAQTKLQIAQMQVEASSKPANQITLDPGGKLDGIAQSIADAASAQGEGIAEAVNTLAQVSATLVESIDEMRRPKRRLIERDPQTGRAIGAIEVAE